jgi:hypothetical protein
MIGADFSLALSGTRLHMKASEWERWARTRTQGMSRFVLLRGVLAYGLPMFVIMTFLFPHPNFTKPQSAMLWLLTGAGYGIAMWLMQEYRYRKGVPKS